MSDEFNGLTRRAMLRGVAVAGAASLVRPAAGIGLAAKAGPGVFSCSVGSLAGESGAIAAPRAFALVGVEWRAPAHATIEVRTRRAGEEAWSRWATASVLGHGPDQSGPETRSAQFGEAIWTGPADYVQLRSSGPVQGVRLHFVAATPAADAGSAHAAQALPLAQPVLDAGPGQPPIIARAAWAQGHAPPSHVPLYGTVKLAFVHHSETPNGYGAGEVPSILRAIFAYHRYVRGYFDIAYNFAIDEFGRIWEARAGGVDLPVIGAHAGGYNQESTGMVVLGSFMDVVPSAAAIGALEQLLAWKLSLHGVPVLGRVTVEVAPDATFYTPFRPGAHVPLPRVAGHRDGDQTSCPGTAFYARLPSIRPRAAELTGMPARATITAPAAPVSAGSAVTATGLLTDLATGSPLAGAPIELQVIGPHIEQTIATLTTAADGSWSDTFTPAANTLVRALHRPAPAAVSDVALVAVAPTLTLSLVSTAPLVVSGTVSPPIQPVTVSVYKLVHGRRQLIASKRLAATGGQFRAQLRTAGAGNYVVIAQTTASVQYVGAGAPPLTVAV
jgi:N-acetylmuramoyl-L-alanine amidase